MKRFIIALAMVLAFATGTLAQESNIHAAPNAAAVHKKAPQKKKATTKKAKSAKKTKSIKAPAASATQVNN